MDTSKLNNSRFLSRIKVFRDKFNLTKKKKFNPKTEYEKELTKKYNRNSSNIKNTIESTKHITDNKLTKEIKKIEVLKLNLADINQRNIYIQNKIIINEQKVDDYISSKLFQAEKKLNDIYKEILVARKKNFYSFDNRSNFYYQSNKSIRTLKKKLYLLMNILKLKILDKRLLNANYSELNLNEKNIANLGYFLKIHKNRVKPIYIDVSMDEVSRTVYFWNNFCEYFKSDP